MSRTIAATAVIHPNVVLGEDVTIEDYCVIGAPFRGYASEPTRLGDGAIVRSHSVIYAGNQIGTGFQTGNKANIRELNTIGNDVSIGTLSVVEHHVRIGNGVRIHTQAFIPEYSILEDGSWIGPNVVLTNSKYPLAANSKDALRGPRICERAVVGANATILPGVVVGAGALVGAGSVVVRDVPPDLIVIGNPARAGRPLSAVHQNDDQVSRSSGTV